MLSPQLLDHFQNPRNVGELPPPAIMIEVTNPACGDILRLSALFANGRATEVRYKVRGCTASIAAGSALTECLLETPVAAWPTLRPEIIEHRLGGISNESRHALALCIDATRALVSAYNRHP